MQGIDRPLELHARVSDSGNGDDRTNGTASASERSCPRSRVGVRAGRLTLKPAEHLRRPLVAMHLLDNIPWHSLAGPHAKYSSGTTEARRYASGFSPIIGFVNLRNPDFDALAESCASGEHFYCGGLSGAVPSGWRIEGETTASQMIWDGALPDADRAFAAIRLEPSHVAQILDLVAATQPGPFAERTIELGDYYGVFEGARLVSMAGERMAAGPLREISGVCTHPEFQGRGYARRLVEKLIRLEMQRNEIPFLHVTQDNSHARRIYERMGFRHHQEVTLQVISRE